MKRGKLFIQIILVFLLSLNLVSASAPVLFFSDLSSGPNIGGQNNKGVFVTIWGKNFGSSRGSSYVTIGNGQADNYPLWSDTKITFQLGSSAQTGNIVLHTSEGDSNALPFTIRAGRIFFVSKSQGNNNYNGLYQDYQGGSNGPWYDFTPFDDYAEMLKPGDTVYVRAGLYDKVVSGWDTNLHIRPHHTGSQGNEIALIGYPNENALINGSGIARRGIILREGVTDWVISNLKFTEGSGDAISAGYNMRIRIVGNEIYNYPSYYGSIEFSSCHDCKVLGNHIYNSGQEENKLAHLIYYGGYGAGSNVEIAWNLLHDELGGRCIQVYGHSDDDYLTGLSIHDNLLYNCPYDGIIIGASDASVQDWVKDAVVYNNIVYNTGSAQTSWWSGIRINNPGVELKLFNNIIIQNQNSGFALNLESAKSAEVYNNIFVNRAGIDIIYYGTVGNLVIGYNLYSKGNGKPSCDTSTTSLFVSDIGFVNEASNDFHLKSISPAIDAGTSAVSFVVTKDFDGNLRPQGNGFDIGAYEYVSSQQTYHPADTNQNGKIEMTELIAFIGKWKLNQANINDVISALDRWFRGS